MAAPDITVRRRPGRAVGGRDRASTASTRVADLVVWTVLAAVVVGLAVGALACSAALAAGSGHLVHAQAPIASSDDGHGTVHDAAEGAAPLAASVGAGYDTQAGSAGTGGQGHPGMACVVTVELDLAAVATPVVTARFEGSRLAPLPECVGDVDPPVPRFS